MGMPASGRSGTESAPRQTPCTTPFPRDEFPEYEWKAWNLVALAGDVHDQMHDRVTGALTDKGKQLLKLVARRAGVDVPERYQ